VALKPFSLAILTLLNDDKDSHVPFNFLLERKSGRKNRSKLLLLSRTREKGVRDISSRKWEESSHEGLE